MRTSSSSGRDWGSEMNAPRIAHCNQLPLLSLNLMLGNCSCLKLSFSVASNALPGSFVVHGRFNRDRELVRVLAIERLEHAVEKAWQLADGDRTRNLDRSSARFGRARIRRGQDEIAGHVLGDLQRKLHRTIARLGQAVNHALVLGCFDQGRPDRGLIYLSSMQRFDHAATRSLASIGLPRSQYCSRMPWISAGVTGTGQSSNWR